MKKTKYILLVMLLLGGLFGMAQIKPIKKPKTTPKTEQTAKPAKSNSSSNSKPKASKKNNSNSSSQLNSSSVPSLPNTTIKPDNPTTSSAIPLVVQQAINDMVRVEGDTYWMGSFSKYDNDYNDEKPSHKVTLSSYYIGRYEVTQELWFAVMGTNPSNFIGDSHRPVERVSWNDCQIFIHELNALTGKQFRLPTEAEWEFAARGGNLSKGYKYSGSSYLDDVAWCRTNSTQTVGTKSPNELGIYDMSGNVFEWCEDWYSESYYNSSTSFNPTGPSTGSYKVLRGGCWNDASYCRSTRRHSSSPGYLNFYIGLRLAASSL